MRETMAGMGGIPQIIEMLAVAVVVFATLLLVAFLVGKLFENKKTRKRIVFGAIAIYLLGFIGYFGWIAFILSGNLN